MAPSHNHNKQQTPSVLHRVSAMAGTVALIGARISDAIDRAVIDPFSNWLDQPARSRLDKTPSREDGKGLSRRTLLRVAVASTVAGGMADNFLDQHPLDTGELSRTEPAPGRKKDVLTSPNKFRRFVKTHKDMALELAHDPEMPLPYEVFLAVSMHESDSGNSELAKKAHNLFGVVAKDGWTGEIYPKVTEEQVPKASLKELKQAHPELKELYDNPDGTVRVSYSRPFRKYPSDADSFADFSKKVYFRNSDGSYRYADVVDYLKSGGRNPYRVAELMSDRDQPGELAWATGSEWQAGVKRYIRLIRAQTGIKSKDIKTPVLKPEEKASVPEAALPDNQSEIKISAIPFEGLKTSSEKKVRTRMNEAFANASEERFLEFMKSGISEESERVIGFVGSEYYNRVYGSDIKDSLKFIVLHLWANGVKVGGVNGNSHSAVLTDQIQSWRNSGHNSASFLLSDNPEADLWQLTRTRFGKANHVGSGIQDEGAQTHRGVNNDNAIGIEIQADSIFDVSATQYETLLYWTTQMLLESGLVQKGMDRETVDQIVDQTVIGHGKNNGYEFGYKYSRPFVAAVQQFIFMAVQ